VHLASLALSGIIPTGPGQTQGFPPGKLTLTLGKASPFARKRGFYCPEPCTRYSVFWPGGHLSLEEQGETRDRAKAEVISGEED